MDDSPPPHTLLGQLPLHVRAAMHADKMHKSSDHRRSNKPIMEKRRRARINHCLGELKGLILDAMKKDPARHSKLEKADILEMTVKHLQNMQRQQMAIAVATDPSVMTRFRNGFGECATEVARYVARLEGVDPAVRQRLLGHLRSCLSGLNQLSPAAFACLVPGLTAGAGGLPAAGAAASFLHSPFQQQQQQLHVPPATFSQFANLSGSAGDAGGVPTSSRGMVGGLHLFPSRLPNGDIAFVLPSHQASGGGGDYPAPSDAAPPPASPSPGTSSPSPPPPPVVPAPHMPPAFPTNPPVTASVGAISSTSSERRTPSAFTSVLNNVGAAPPPRLLLSGSPLTTCTSDAPTRAASPSPGSNACTVSSTTSSGKLGPLSPLCYEGDDVGCAASTTTTTSSVTVTTDGIRAPPEVKREMGDHGQAHHRLAATKSQKSKQSGGGCCSGRDEQVEVVVVAATVVKSESAPKTRTATNQTEAYDLSRPSTSMSDNDVMWRPW